MSQQSWSREIPTEPGWYWFRGYISEKDSFFFSEENIWDIPVEVFPDGGMTLGTSEFTDRSHFRYGWWIKIDLPPVPEKID